MKNLMFNLQLFADANVQATTTTGLSDEMKQFYSKDLIELASANLIHAQFGQKTAIPPNGGKTIEFRKWSAFAKATNALTEGVTPNGSAVVVDKITKTLEQYGNYTTVSDLLDLTAIDNVIVEITGKHADNMALTLDTIVRNELATCSSVIRANDIASSGLMSTDDKISVKLIMKAAAMLKKNNTPKIDGYYVCIIHPSVAFDLMSDEAWVDANKYTNAEAIFKGEIGRVGGVRFVESTEALITMNTPTDEDDDPIALYSCFMFGRDAYKVIDIQSANAGIIVKGAGSAGTADPLDQRSTIGWKVPLYGAKIAVPEYIVRMEVASSFSDVDAAN